MAENTELMTVDNIYNRVYIIRGQQVMLDYDLAEILEDFLKSQIATLNENGNKRGLHIKKLPYAFTEQGIYMLATVLRGELAE